MRKTNAIATENYLEVTVTTVNPGFLTTPLKACACAGEQGSRGE
ncbi:hypothetical protein [Nostoc sp. UHCC 0251]|nr:hypothetical protein [Nostoc sp. UHCC 0251]MEA5626057.1 hypothetical protein [Nostoc sp. UHCC 0251]